jgi:hypothetical protein
MGKATPQQQAAYCKAKAAGKSNKAAMQAAGATNHQAMDWAWYQHAANPNKVTLLKGFTALPEKQQGAAIAEMYAKGESFGRIWVATGLPTEGRVRTLFEMATGQSSTGQRRGHGGRMYKGEKRYYQGNNKGLGTQHAKGSTPNPEAVQAASNNKKDTLPAAVAKAKAAAKGRAQRASKQQPKK